MLTFARGFIVASAVVASPIVAEAAIYQEYLNNYGSATAVITTKGGASDGWSGGWAGSAANNYVAGSQLTYNGTGYVNSENQSDADDGLVAAGTGATTITISGRALPGLTGTIWISTLTRFDSNTDDILFWLDTTGTNNNNFVALRGGSTNGDTDQTNGLEPYMRYNNGANLTSNNTPHAINTAHLLLVKVDMNVGSTVNDSFSYWVNPDVSGGGDGILTEADLGPAIYSGSGADPFGTSFDGIGVSFNSSGNQFDAIRVSTEGIAGVISVPEPSTSVIAVAAGLGILAQRKRRRA